MSLRLIYSAREDETPTKDPVPVDRFRVAILAAVLFLAIKLPMCFVTNNPEELRDFDHFVKASQGEYAYRDFAWIYGPVTPILYGAALKILPEKLITIRLITLLIWGVGVAFCVLLISRYFTQSYSLLFGGLFASGVLGYPSYSHNHILAAVATIVCAYYLLKYLEEGEMASLAWSFVAMAVVFFTRPILMGYGVTALWFGILFVIKPDLKRVRALVTCLAFLFVGFAVFLLIYGSPVMSAFFPKPWEVLTSKGYPNLHYLIPQTLAGATSFKDSVAKPTWAALETAVFYLHFFIWPTLIFTLYALLPKHQSIRAAAICCAFAWVASLDLLHYGFSDPISEQAMWVRGQYFFALTACSLFLRLYPTTTDKTQPVKRAFAIGVLILVSAWAYMPYVLGLQHLRKFSFNEYDFPALQGILTHPDRRFAFEAVQFINSHCGPNDYVVIPQYDPGLGQLLKCRELFGRDAYIFTRQDSYELGPWESPYAPRGSVTNGALIQQLINQYHPRFYLVQGTPEYSNVCEQTGWTSRQFGTGANGRRVCFLP
jgi:hypothetical protein